jgi:hypothetical protein
LYGFEEGDEFNFIWAVGELDLEIDMYQEFYEGFEEVLECMDKYDDDDPWYRGGAALTKVKVVINSLPSL